MQIPLTCDKGAVASRSCSPKRHLFHLTPGIQVSTDARIPSGCGKPISTTIGRPELDSRKNFFFPLEQRLFQQVTWYIDSIQTLQVSRCAPQRCGRGIWLTGTGNLAHMPRFSGTQWFHKGHGPVSTDLKKAHVSFWRTNLSRSGIKTGTWKAENWGPAILFQRICEPGKGLTIV